MSASEMERLKAALWEAREHLQRMGWSNSGGAILRVRIDAALSGSSAPQATDSEELLKALRAASRQLCAFACVRTLQQRVDGIWDDESITHNACCVEARAALSMKIEPEDAGGGSQKGSGR